MRNTGWIGNASILIMSLYSMVILKSYFEIFFKPKYGVWKSFAWITFFTWQINLNFNVIRLGFGGGGNIVLSLGSIVLVSAVCFEGKKWRKIVLSFLFSALWMITEPLVRYGSISTAIVKEPSVLFVSILSKLLLCIFVLIIRWSIKNKNKEEIEWGNLQNEIWLTLLPFASMVLYYIFYKTGEAAGTESVSGMLAVGAVLLIIINLMLYPVYLKLVEGAREKEYNFYYLTMLTNYRRQRVDEEAAITEVRAARHDLKHKLIYLYEINRLGENGLLDQTLKGMLEQIGEGRRQIVKTGNLEIDAAVNWEAQKAEGLGIKLHINLEVPGKLDMKEGDLSILLGNALDNAVEASSHAEEEKREIWLLVRYEKGMLLIEIKNRYDGVINRDKHGRLKTRKRQPDHGLGYGSIENIVKRYHGTVEIREKGDVFSLNLILYA